VTRLRKVAPTPELVQLHPELKGRTGWDLGVAEPEGLIIEWDGLERRYAVPEALLDVCEDHGRGAVR